MQITRRPASAADFEVTLEIKKQALGPYIEQVWGWDDQFQRAYHSDHFKPHNTVLLLDAGREVGLIEVTEATNSFFIQNLLIIPGFQNKGIGTYLLKQLISNALQVHKSVFLDVLKVNKSAFKLYQRLGFTTRDTTELTFQLVLSAQHDVHNS